MLQIMQAVVAKMTRTPFSKHALESVSPHLFTFGPCAELLFFFFLSFARVDDMLLESFEGLEIVPRETLKLGTVKISAGLQIAVVVDCLKKNATITSIR